MKIIYATILALVTSTVAPATTPVALNMTHKEFKCLTENVYHEARGEPFQGQIMVAKVTLNRAKNKNICDVVYAKRQFSWTLLRPLVTNKQAYNIAAQAAAQANKHPTKATHYHADYVKPSWAKKLTRLEKQGRHIFYV